MYNPCDGLVKCINLAPGFRCEPCPNGYDGNGYYAQSISEDHTNQLCTGNWKYFPLNRMRSKLKSSFANVITLRLKALM